jgi:high-affinity nickel permease
VAGEYLTLGHASVIALLAFALIKMINATNDVMQQLTGTHSVDAFLGGTAPGMQMKPKGFVKVK